MRVPTSKRIWLCILTAIVCASAMGWAAGAEPFTGIKEVRLTHGDLGSPKARTLVITDKAKIDQLVATIKLEKKTPCACDHIDWAVFVKDKDKSEIKVSLCDHCFDIGKETYAMPAEFYKLYTAYMKEAPKP